jgi:hypothetical protein
VEYYRASCRILAPSMFHSHSAKFGVGSVGVGVSAAVGHGQFMCVLYNVYVCVLLYTQDASSVACNF